MQETRQETAHGEFILLKNHKNAFVIDDFDKRYSELLDKYPYVVGDYSAGVLRLKGFPLKGQESYKNIPDYLVESCIYDCPYFILKNDRFNPNLVLEEE